MDTVILALIALVIGAGVAGGLVSTWSLHRRTYRLELRIQDIEERQLTVKNREKVAKRWEKQKDVESEFDEFLALSRSAKPTAPRFANDPIEVER